MFKKIIVFWKMFWICRKHGCGFFAAISIAYNMMQVCVMVFEVATPEQLAEMDAWMKDNQNGIENHEASDN